MSQRVKVSSGHEKKPGGVIVVVRGSESCAGILEGEIWRRRDCGAGPPVQARKSQSPVRSAFYLGLRLEDDRDLVCQDLQVDAWS